MMENSKPGISLYQRFLTYEYSDLEDMVSKAETSEEREFWTSLCDYYLKKQQKHFELQKLLQEGLDASRRNDVRSAEDVFADLERKLKL